MSFRLYFIDEVKAKLYITTLFNGTVNHSLDIKQATIFRGEQPDHIKQTLERRNNYVNLLTEEIEGDDFE